MNTERKPQQPLGKRVKWGSKAENQAGFGVSYLPRVEFGILTWYGSGKELYCYPRTLAMIQTMFSKISELAKYHLRINLHSLSDPHNVEWLHPEPLSHRQHHFMPHIADLNSWSNLAVLLPLVVNFKTRLNYFYHDSAKIFKLVDVTLGYPAIIILPSLAPMFITFGFFYLLLLSSSCCHRT